MKRAAIYTLWDKNGTIRDFVIYYLHGLMSICEKVIVIVQGRLSIEGRKKLEGLGIIVSVVEDSNNVKLAAYKKGLDILQNYDNDYDEIILTNCSSYGPIFPFEEMFSAMEIKECDFWTIADAVFRPGEDISEQLYFFVIRKKLFLSYEWNMLWKSFESSSDIYKYAEILSDDLLAYFSDKGFKYEAYCKKEPYYINMTLESPDSLIIKQRCPILRRRVFCSEYNNLLDYQRGDVVRKIFDYLRTENIYDINMILDDLLETENYYHIKNALHLNYFLPSDRVISHYAGKPKVALCFHVYYEDLLENSLCFMESIPPYADLYITTSNSKLYPLIEMKCAERKIRNLKSVKYINSRGRAESAFLVATKDFIYHYDYACIVHDKLTARITPTIIGKEFGSQNLDALLKSPEYVENIIGLFEHEPRLGMLEPVNTIHSIYGDVTYGFEWSPIEENYLGVLDLLDKMHISIPIDRNLPPVCPMGAMFWVRPAALKKLIDLSWEYEDFPQEPLPPDGSLIHIIERVYPFVVQDAGYLIGWVSSIEDAEVHLTNLTYKYRNLRVKSGWDNCNIWDEEKKEKLMIELEKKYQEREQKILDDFYHSTSWKITRPWRAIGELIKSIKRNG